MVVFALMGIEKSHVLKILPCAVVMGIMATAVGCGGSLRSKGPAATACDPMTTESDEQRPHFVTRQLRGSSSEGASVLYRLFAAEGRAQPVVVRGADSTDAWPLRDRITGKVFLLERFFGSRKSRLTRTACDAGGSKREQANLPPNTFGLSYLNDSTLAAVGWNDGTVVKFTADFKETLVDNVRVQPAEGAGLQLTSSDQHLNSVLVAPAGAFVLSTGYDLTKFAPAQAKILGLTEDLQRIRSVADIPQCVNAYQDYTLQISASAMVIGCNPQFSEDNGQPVQLVLVSVSDDGRVESKVLSKAEDSQTRIMVPGGLTQDKKWVLVTEETVTPESKDSATPGVFLRSYWLSVETGERRPMGQFGGRLAYDAAAKIYVLSCAVDAVMTPCKSGGFVVLKAESWDKPEAAVWKAVSFDYEFYQFERTIF
jgi:hypothetical protein